jgi:uncharacterized phiE125 gp8 family phage protein
MSLVLLTPGDQAVSTADAKKHLYVDTSLDDSMIDGFVLTATELLEEELYISIPEQTWVRSYSQWPLKTTFMRGPATAIVEIRYWDEDDVQQTLDVNNYEIIKFDKHTQLMVKPNISLPTISSDRREPIEVEYTAGWPVANIPKPLLNAIKMVCTDLYENREGQVPVKLEDNPHLDSIRGLYSMKPYL